MERDGKKHRIGPYTGRILAVLVLAGLTAAGSFLVSDPAVKGILVTVAVIIGAGTLALLRDAIAFKIYRKEHPGEEIDYKAFNAMFYNKDDHKKQTK